MKRQLMMRTTIRARLTLVYGGLFLLAGMVLLAVTYVLVGQRMPGSIGVALSSKPPLPPETDLPKTGLGGQNTEALRIFAQKVQEDVKESALDSLLTQGGIALAVVSAAAIAFGWLIAGRALQPLHQITGTARRIADANSAGGGLHERIALRGPQDEVRELADTFDLMLERLDRSFDGQRRFVANASHELRTPLALNRALVELAMTRPGASADVRQLGESLLSVNERHERLIEGLLTLADSESELTERTPIDLAEVAAHVLNQYASRDSDGDQGQGQGQDPARELARAAVREFSAARTVGDPVLLERLTSNLVENALRYNVPARGWVSVRTGLVDGRPTLMVSNTGPVVPGYEIETIFQPFRRLRGERLGGGRGFGLGLSIVRAVARAHGGSVDAQPREGGGLVVIVTLPRP